MSNLKNEFLNGFLTRAKYNGPNDQIGKVKLDHGKSYDIFVVPINEFNIDVYVITGIKYAIINYDSEEPQCDDYLANDWGGEIARKAEEYGISY